MARNYTQVNKSCIVCPDGYVWLDVTENARGLYSHTSIPLYQLYNDGGESLITSIDDVEEAITNGHPIVIDVAFVHDIVKHHTELTKVELINNNTKP